MEVAIGRSVGGLLMPEALEDIWAKTKRPTLDELYKGDSKAAPPKESGSAWSSAGDFFKSIPGGVLKGLTATAAASGQAEMGVQTGGADTMQNLSGLVTGQKPQGVPGAEESFKLAGGDRLPKPQGTAGRFGESIGEAFGTPSSYMQPGGVVAKTLSILGSAIGGQAGAETGSPGAAVAGGVIGGGVPGAVSGAARGLARVAPVTDPVRGMFNKTLAREGVTPTAGETLGSKGLQEFERFGSLPGGGGSYERLKNNTEAQLTGAILKKMGEGGETALTPEVAQRSSDRIGRAFDESTKKIGVTFDEPFRDKVENIRLRLLRGSDPNTISQVDKMLTRMLPESSPGDLWRVDKSTKGQLAKMSGTVYHDLIKTGGDLWHMINSNDANVKRFGLDIKKLLDSQVERSARGAKQKEGLAQFKEAKKQWWVRELALNAADTDTAGLGHVDPDKLVSVIGDKAALQEGRTDVHELALAAQNILKPYRPLGFGGAHESGGRGMISQGARLGMAGAGGAAGFAAGGVPGAVAGTVAGAVAPGMVSRGLNHPVVQEYLKGNRPFQQWLEKKGLLKKQPATSLSQKTQRALTSGIIGSERENPSTKAQEKPRPQLYE